MIANNHIADTTKRSALLIDFWQLTEDTQKILVSKRTIANLGPNYELHIDSYVAAGGKVYQVTTHDELNFIAWYRGEVGTNSAPTRLPLSAQEMSDAIPLAPISKIRCPACKYPYLPETITVNKTINDMKEYHCNKCNHDFWNYQAEYITEER